VRTPWWQAGLVHGSHSDGSSVASPEERFGQPVCSLVGRTALPQRDGHRAGAQKPVLWAGDLSSQPHRNPAEISKNITEIITISTALSSI